MLKLFMLLDYRGGTYISQVEAIDPHHAIAGWCGQLADENLAEWRMTASDAAILQEDAPVALDNLSNAWCARASSKDGHLMLLNIIATGQST